MIAAKTLAITVWYNQWLVPQTRQGHSMPTDIRALLRELDLEVHYESFLENGIGQDILSQLTDEDLKELGVTKLGDRKRILNRLAQVCLLYTSPSPRDISGSRMPSSA